MVRLNVVNRISCFCFIIFILRGIGVALGTMGTPGCGTRHNDCTYDTKVMVIRVADGKVAAVQIHLPSHLLRTVLLHLSTATMPATLTITITTPT